MNNGYLNVVLSWCTVVTVGVCNIGIAYTASSRSVIIASWFMCIASIMKCSKPGDSGNLWNQVSFWRRFCNVGDTYDANSMGKIWLSIGDGGLFLTPLCTGHLDGRKLYMWGPPVICCSATPFSIRRLSNRWIDQDIPSHRRQSSRGPHVTAVVKPVRKVTFLNQEDLHTRGSKSPK
jgi:hypothetical protein